MKKGPFWGFIASVFERSLVVAFIGLVITPLSLLAVGVTYQFQWGSFGSGNGQLNTPYSATSDPDGFIYITNTGNSRVDKFDSDGNFVDTFGSVGTDDGEFGFTTDIILDDEGDIYVTDNTLNRVQKFDNDGNFLLKWGEAGTGNGQFDVPFGIAYYDERIYVVDRENARVQIFDKNGNFIDVFGNTGTGEGVLDYPIGIFINEAGLIYVLDQYRIVVYNQNLDFQFTWGEQGLGPGQFQVVSDLFIDSSGNVYATDAGNHRVQVFNLDGDYIFEFGTFGLGDGQFFIPLSVNIRSELVYVVDAGNHRVQSFEIDLPPAVLEASSVTLDGFYGAGSVIAVEVLFDEPVTSSGAITLTFDSGGTCDIAQIVVATNTISCSYAVLDGEDSDDLDVSMVGGTFLDSNLNESTDLTPLVNIGNTSDIVVDTTDPNPPVVSSQIENQTGNAISTLFGTSEPYGDIVVSYEGVNICSVTASDLGAWSCSFTAIEEYDTHVFSLTQEDRAGNISPVGTFSVTRSTSGGGYVGGGCGILNGCDDEDDQDLPIEGEDVIEDPVEGGEIAEDMIVEEYDFSEEQEFLPDGLNFTLEDIDPDGECYAFEAYLRQGNRGDEVTKIQKFLSYLGFYGNDKIDGSFGPMTDLAVRAFQSSRREKILDPWNLVSATGYWYKTTRGTANQMIGCHEGEIILENGNKVTF